MDTANIKDIENKISLELLIDVYDLRTDKIQALRIGERLVAGRLLTLPDINWECKARLPVSRGKSRDVEIRIIGIESDEYLDIEVLD